MTCWHCKNSLPDGSQFCNKCGATVPPAQGVPYKRDKAKLSTAAWVVIFAVGIPCLMCAIGGIFIIKSDQNTAPSVTFTSPSNLPSPVTDWLATASQQEVHDELKTTYLAVVQRINNNYYNGVRVRITKNGNGYDLWAEHSFFSQVSFDIGDFGKAVNYWRVAMGDVLNKGKIKRVGVRDPGPYGGSQWYNVTVPEALGVRQRAAKELIDLEMK